MSLDIASERVCYLHCNFCNTVLAVNFPCNKAVMSNSVTVRCGCCANLLSLNSGSSLQTAHLQNAHKENSLYQEDSQSSSKCSKVSMLDSSEDEQSRTLSANAMGKRQRAPSAYNRFIKEEIRRIKATNPEISHREAFGAAAKNWAHLPRSQFGLKLNNSMNEESRQQQG